MTWLVGDERYTVDRETDDGKWCVTVTTWMKWRNVYMTEKELYKVLYDHNRKELVPLDLQAEFEGEHDRYDLS
jgi:hypothetical protein